MGCLTCGGKGKAAPRTMMICAICDTELHCKKKDVCRIGDSPVCGKCMARYRKAKGLEKGEKKK